MSRHAAATSAGRSRTVQRTAPAPPRRVSGPVAPNRRDAEPSRGEQRAARAGSRSARAAAAAASGPPRARVEQAARAQRERAAAEPQSSRARIDAAARGHRERAAAAPRPPRARIDAAARPPRARIDASALAYADGAIAVQGPFTARRRFVAPRAPRPQRLAYGGVAIASRVANVAVDVSASRLMDRLVRGRVWIGVVAFCLIGLVATQVSLLKLNSGIGRAVQTASTLERSNASLRAEISRLSAGDRIQRLAGSDAMVMPAPSDVKYLRAAGGGDAARAAQRMQAPDPNVALGPAGAATTAAPPVTATALGTVPGQVQPAGTTPTGATPAGATPPGATPAGATPVGATPTGATPTGATPAGATPAATTPAATAQTPATTNPAAAGAATQSGGAAPQATTQIP